MYNKYVVDLSTDNFKKLEAESKMSQLNNKEKKLLREFFNETTKFTNINALEKMDELFPVKSYDVFISHSHNDLSQAKILKSYLETNFDLKVFIDSDYWESSDEYLKELDNEYCKLDSGNYSYEKRNLTTSHVHVMLAISIMKIIKESEVVLFLSTDEFAGAIFDKGFSEIHSPWIYLETFTTKIIHSVPKRISNQFRDSFKALEEQAKLNIQYNVAFDKSEKINMRVLNAWSTKFLVNRNSGKVFKHPLDLLYEIAK